MDPDADRLTPARSGPLLRPGPVNTACARALELDVVDVRKIARMLEQATERDPAPTTAQVVGGPGSFARDTTEYQAGRS